MKRSIKWRGGRAFGLAAILAAGVGGAAEATVLTIDLTQATIESGSNSGDSTWDWNPADGQFFDLEFSSGDGGHVDLDGGTLGASEYYTGTESAGNHAHDILRASYLGNDDWRIEALRGQMTYNLGTVTEYAGELSHADNYRYNLLGQTESDPVYGPAGAGTGATVWEPWKGWFWIYRNTNDNTISLNIVVGSAQETPPGEGAKTDQGNFRADYLFSGSYTGTPSLIVANEPADVLGTNPFHEDGPWSASLDDGAVLGGIVPVAIPEPASILLAGLGAALLLRERIRRRRASRDA